MDNTQKEKEFLYGTYKRLPIEIERGEGVFLRTKDGKEYLDMFGGLAVNALGYGHKGVLDAIRAQSDKYIHLSNYFIQEPQICLAEIILKQSGYRKIFFTNSGTESVEGAIKIARKWGSQNKRKNIISFSNSFHGRTMGSLSLMDKSSYKSDFGPFLDNVTVIDYNDAAELRETVSSDTAAVILEFIQGEGGIQEASPEFVTEIKELREKYGFLLIADEIQSGLGRTGKLFSFQHYDIHPDIVVLAKPLGGGLPLGAILGSEAVKDILQPGNHGTTFGGNPVACAAGIAVMNELINNKVMQNASGTGDYFKSQLNELMKAYPEKIREVRGRGLMLGMELHFAGDSVVNAMRERGVLINCTNQNVLRFLPPLTINNEHVNRTVQCMHKIYTAND